MEILTPEQAKRDAEIDAQDARIYKALFSLLGSLTEDQSTHEELAVKWINLMQPDDPIKMLKLYRQHSERFFIMLGLHVSLLKKEASETIQQ